MQPLENKIEKAFTKYEIFLIAILSILLFTSSLGFMIIAPLGVKLIRCLQISPSQFGFIVSAYAFSAGVSCLFSSGFSDKFDRKKFLLFFYAGFILGTFLCSVASTYEFLLIARVVTGIFGGVIGGTVFAIIADVFKFQVRGRVMGFAMMAFSASQVMGIPIGLFLANKYNWHTPFLFLAIISLLISVILIKFVKPVTGHLIKSYNKPFLQIGALFSKKEYLLSFVTMALTSIGAFIIAPFANPFMVNNIKVLESTLPLIFFIAGLATITIGPIAGKLCDKVGSFKIFILASVVYSILVFIFCNLGLTPTWVVISIYSILYVGVSGRIVSSSTLLTSVANQQDRGGFMNINSSVQQVAGGLGSILAGLIVSQENGYSPLENFHVLGYVSVAVVLISTYLMFYINKYVNQKEALVQESIIS